MKKAISMMGAVAGVVIIAAILTKAPLDISVPDEIFGYWSGKGTLKSDGSEIDVNINIEENHIVSGEIGEAVFENAIIKRTIIDRGTESGDPPEFVIETVFLNGKLDGNDNETGRMINIMLYREEDEITGFIEPEGLFVFPDVIVEDIFLIKQE